MWLCVVDSMYGRYCLSSFSKDVYILIVEPFEYIILHAKSNLASNLVNTIAF